ncbi:uncharacterized protein B0H18DRAFT_986692 [Fomitopsis serialis]|uniref:uncharacterized protein n=1 Tax=Fomitopsis serialis TaxID=139415 RepID=UPI002008C003|nr:uncharacterized protein B0H18DRAFT_986692 [Neoantrodia serialis]KAH9932622.1 hypothetical protein B0H18DRAFT_986692 [Neoantrodia serialis]
MPTASWRILTSSLPSYKAIYAYDRCLTLWREVDLVWSRRKMSVATGLYLVMHISVAMFLAFEVSYTTIKTCEVRHTVIVIIHPTYKLWIVYVWRVSCAMLFHVVYGAFTALRAYAIGYRSVWLGWATFLWSLVVVAIEIYEVVVSVPVNVPQPIGCVITTKGNEKFLSTCAAVSLHLASWLDSLSLWFDLLDPVFIAGQATAIVPEVLLIGAIWRHALRAAAIRSLRQYSWLDTPFTTILIRDGEASLVLIVLNVVWSAVTSVNTGILAPIVYSLQTILLSYFYLNLHETNVYSSGMPSSESSQLSDPRLDGSAPESTDTENDLDWDSRLDETMVELSVIGRRCSVDRSQRVICASSVGSVTSVNDISTTKAS